MAINGMMEKDFGWEKGQQLIIDHRYFCSDLRKRTGAGASNDEPELEHAADGSILKRV